MKLIIFIFASLTSICGYSQVDPSVNEKAAAAAGNTRAIEKIEQEQNYHYPANSVSAPDDSAGRSSLSGVVKLHGPDKIWLPGVPLILKIHKKGSWKTIDRVTSGPFGQFDFASLLAEGEYWVGAEGKKYKDGLKFSLKDNEKKKVDVFVNKQ